MLIQKKKSKSQTNVEKIQSHFLKRIFLLTSRHNLLIHLLNQKKHKLIKTELGPESQMSNLTLLPIKHNKAPTSEKEKAQKRQANQ